MKTIYEFGGTENPVLEASTHIFAEIEKVLSGREDYDGLIQDVRDKILELKGIMLSECYVPRHIADLLSELGFNRVCSYIYDENDDLMLSSDPATCNSTLPEGRVIAPTLQEAYRWLRESYNIHFDLVTKKRSGKVLYDLAIKDANSQDDTFPALKRYFGLGSQEEATILGLFWSLEYLLKQKSNDKG